LVDDGNRSLFLRCTSVAVHASSPAVGSSRTRTCADPSKASAMATRLHCPPDMQRLPATDIRELEQSSKPSRLDKITTRLRFIVVGKYFEQASSAV